MFKWLKRRMVREHAKLLIQNSQACEILAEGWYAEKEEVRDLDRFLAEIRPARSMGAIFALDDFGAGFSGLNLLADFQPDYIKLDIRLIKDIARQGPRQAIIRGVMRTCNDLGIGVIAEGVEDKAEFEWLRDVGIRLFQGYLFARPGFETFAAPSYPAS
jgi:EAL domain-containing protein (putative c-di-GMP-specific phosphodiesterase class I)